MKEINTVKKNYIDCAAGLGMGNFTNVKPGQERVALIDKIANMYCDATANKNELLRSQTMSALILLFYGEAKKMAEKMQSCKRY